MASSFIGGSASYTCGTEPVVEDLVASLTDPSRGYDRAVRPTRAAFASEATDAASYERAMSGSDVAPDLVGVSAALASISELSQVQQTLEATGMFSTTWVDARLAFANVSSGGCHDEVPLLGASLDRVWRPDVSWVNLIRSHAREEVAGVTSETSSGAPVASLRWDGTVTVARSMTATFSCADLDYGRYPFDTQECAMVAASAGSLTGDVVLVVDDSSLALLSTVDSLSFRFVRTDVVGGRSDGSVSLAVSMKRRRYYFFTSVFAPVTCFVIIAGSSFIVDRFASSARVALSALSLLIMISQIQYRVDVPDVPRPIWLKTYLGVSIYFIMACILEYSFVSYYVSRERSAAARGAAYLEQLLHDLRSHFAPERQRRPSERVSLALATPRRVNAADGDGDDDDGDRDRGGDDGDRGSGDFISTLGPRADAEPASPRMDELTDLVLRLSSAQLAPARATFDAHATGGGLHVAELKNALRDFGIYFSFAQAERAISIVVPGPAAATRSLKFDDDDDGVDDGRPGAAATTARVDGFPCFVVLLSAIEGHHQRAFSGTSTNFADVPRSKQIDDVACVLYFPAYALFALVMFLNIDAY